LFSRKELLSVDKVPKMSATQFGNFLHPGGTTRVITATNGRSSASGFAPDASPKLSGVNELSPHEKLTGQSKGWHLLN